MDHRGVDRIDIVDGINGGIVGYVNSEGPYLKPPLCHGEWFRPSGP